MPMDFSLKFNSFSEKPPLTNLIGIHVFYGFEAVMCTSLSIFAEIRVPRLLENQCYRKTHYFLFFTIKINLSTSNRFSAIMLPVVTVKT